MDVGSRVKLEIETCAFGGDGLARPDGRVVFVPGALPGETVLAEISAVKKNFLRARLLRIGIASPHRIEPVCRAFGRCPGCAYAHCAFAAENELKQRQLLDFLASAGLQPEQAPLPPLAPLPELGYRNKLVLHVNKEGSETQIGYVGADNQTVTEIDCCPLCHPEINAELARFLAAPGSRHSVHNRMDLTFRRTEFDGVRFWRNRPVRNATWLREATPVGTLSVPADGFFQVNPGGVAALVDEMRSTIDEFRPVRFLDLYCGVGLFSAVAAERGVPEITGVELAAASIEAAGYNFRQRGREDARFLAGDAAALLPELLAGAPDDTLIAVDPPRTGLAAGMVRALAAPARGALVYVSCHPATWARDAGRLGRAGWKLRRVRLVNQFARTAHFELFSCFVKG